MIAEQFLNSKIQKRLGRKTAADVKRVIALATELVGANKCTASLGIDDVKLSEMRWPLSTEFMKMAVNKG